jgi:hypothetical protein
MPLPKNLLVVVDCSSSMQDMAKSFVAANLVLYIQQRYLLPSDLYLNDPTIIKWSEGIGSESIQMELERGWFSTQGSSRTGPLVAHIDEIRSAENCIDPSILLLSDGCWKDAEVEYLYQWVRKSKLQLNIVSVGADANHLVLKKLATNSRVYAPEDVSLAMNFLSEASV